MSYAVSAAAVMPLALFASMGIKTAQTPPALAVVQAERAFAAEVGRNGFKKGFLAFAAPDAMMFQPAPVQARLELQKAPDKDPPGPPLDWWPTWAGMARSGDLGFTTGGASIPVRYFTVWQKQPDGSWKWIYDGGPPLKEKIGGSHQSAVGYLPAATAAAGSAAKALAEIAPLEADLASIASRDLPGAARKYLAGDGLSAWSSTPSEPGAEGQAADLGRRPAQATLKALGGTASRAGDMAFTYGEVRWTREEKPRWGHYARIWQKRKEGWKLVSDLLVPAPGAPPAA
jgi:ketosteroid isomerase-like protein